MNVRLFKAVWETDQPNRGKLLLMLALAHYADDYGRTFATVAELAKMSRMTERHAWELLKELKEEGLVAVDHSKGHKSHVLNLNVAFKPVNN